MEYKATVHQKHGAAVQGASAATRKAGKACGGGMEQEAERRCGPSGNSHAGSYPHFLQAPCSLFLLGLMPEKSRIQVWEDTL